MRKSRFTRWRSIWSTNMRCRSVGPAVGSDCRDRLGIGHRERGGEIIEARWSLAGRCLRRGGGGILFGCRAEENRRVHPECQQSERRQGSGFTVPSEWRMVSRPSLDCRPSCQF